MTNPKEVEKAGLVGGFKKHDNQENILLENIDIDILITESHENFYLLYDSKQYILFKPYDKTCLTMPVRLDGTPDSIEDNVIGELGEEFDETLLDNGVRVILGSIESIVGDKDKAIDILQYLFIDLSETYYAETNLNDSNRRIERIKAITHPKIVEKINDLSNKRSKEKKDDEIGGLYTSFKNRKGVQKAQRDLGNYLNKECGIILRENTHDLYKLDYPSNGYNSTTVDKIIAELTEIFCDDNLFSTNDVETAINFISERLTPEYNIVKFSNGLYSMKEHQLITPENPVFTLIESPFAYNPNAKPKYIIDYLYSSLEKETQEKTDEYVKGLLEYVGYLFTSGNGRNILGWITGIGGGKSTFANIIQAVFGNRCADLDFAEIEKNTHSTSILVGNHLNIVREAETGMVTNNKPYKTLVGDEPIPINPKNQHPYMLPKEEVPKSVMVANNIPPFKNPVLSIIQRFLIIEFNKIFRNTDDDIKDLDDLIINSNADMEWLIYNSLEAYKEMIESKKGFTLKLDDNKTKELMYKHSKPVNYLVTKLIAKHDKNAFDTDVKLYKESANGKTMFSKPYIETGELNELIVYYAKKDGVEIPLSEKTGKIDGRILTKAIRDEFDLHEYYLETNNGNKKYSSITDRDADGNVIRYYPELIKSELYDETLKSNEYNEYLMEMEKSDNGK